VKETITLTFEELEAHAIGMQAAYKEQYDRAEAVTAALAEACKWLTRLSEAYDAADTEGGRAAIDALQRADMEGFRKACGR
jgi:ABC-type nitrate/sulfonate/bicarbonate transport system substrate-binding protein